MTKKDLFRLIIKIFGLYSVISIIFSVFPSNVGLVLSQIDFIGIVWLIFSLIAIILLFTLLIYKPDKIISWLKLDKGFDEDKIEFQNFNNSNILRLAIIVIGGTILIQNIPAFLSHTLFAFKSSAGNGLNDNMFKFGLRDYIHWATSFLNIILGYLMLTNYNYISKMFKDKDKNNEENKTVA
jgi:hypothetical protein